MNAAAATADLESMLGLAASLARSGEYKSTVQLLEQALQHCAAELDRARVLALLARHYPRLNNLQASVRCGSEALALAEALADEGVLADTLSALAFVYAQLLMGRDALECGLRALSAARRAGDRKREAWALNRVAVAYASLDNPAQACDTTREALEIAGRLASHGGELEFSCLNNLSYFWLLRLQELGHNEAGSAQQAEASAQALSLAEQATASARASDSPFRIAVALSNLAEILVARHGYERAEPLIDEYEALSIRLGYQALELQAAAQRTLIMKARGQLRPAISALNILAQERAAALPPKLRRIIILALYEAHKACGNYREALDHLEQHRDLERQMRRETLALQTEVLMIRQEVEQAQARAEHALRDAQRERERASQLEREQQRLRDQAAAWGRAAHEDVLTGLHNRRHAEFALPLLVEGARQSGKPVMMALIDVDHFKRINDSLGHGVGDRVLQRLAELLRSNLRGADLLARIGGEEFLLVLLGLDARQARDLCERLRLSIAEHDWSDCAPGLAVRISIGMAGGTPPLEAKSLQERADQALYAAKRGGRNQVLGDYDAAADPAP